MEKELNLIDFFSLSFRAFGRALKACWDAFTHVILMMIRYWWVFVLIIGLGIVGGMYYTRFDNRIYKANAIAMINGASIQQFDQTYAILRTIELIPNDAAIKPYLENNTISHLKTFFVIDALNDGISDYTDFDHLSSSTDTVRVRMKDRLCIQFRIKGRNLPQLRDVENALLSYLNSNEALCQSYLGYVANLTEEGAFNHAQAQKLDSLTSYYYFNEKTVIPTISSNQKSSGNVNLYVDTQVKLFLDDIYKQQKHMQQTDYRIQLATAPVVLENHFYLDPTPVNSRLKVMILALFFAWLISYICAELLHNRKAVSAWLKQ